MAPFALIGPLDGPVMRADRMRGADRLRAGRVERIVLVPLTHHGITHGAAA